MYDFVTISKAYVFNPPKKYKDKLEPKTKIAAFKLTSRYKRSTSKKFISEGKIGIDQFNKVNKVYIQYTPWTGLYEDADRLKLKKGLRKCDAIRGWICSCLNGRRRGGSCSHTATVLSYLSWGRLHLDKLKFPGEYLKKIFLQNHKKSNRPSYVRKPRGEKDKDSGSSTDNSSEDEDYLVRKGR